MSGAQAQREPDSRSDSLSILECLQCLGPPRFTGRRGSETAESWYSDIKRLLEGLRFSSEEMVTLVAFTLRDLAYTWWNGVLRAKKTRYASEGHRDPDMR